MAKTNETTNDAAIALYRVNYQYIAPNSQLRAGALIIESTSAEKAKEAALSKLADTSFRHPKITSVKTY